VEAPVGTLSGGNQQKVVLGRWLDDTRVLLLDEPTRGVDVAAKAEIHRHLRALAAAGVALVVASSEIPELLALCDRIAVMRLGRVVGELPRERATPAEILRLAS
jgi:ABC-type sugar transport system ATPase subunit